jgi:hypothetical protein
MVPNWPSEAVNHAISLKYMLYSASMVLLMAIVIAHCIRLRSSVPAAGKALALIDWVRVLTSVKAYHQLKKHFLLRTCDVYHHINPNGGKRHSPSVI